MRYKIKAQDGGRGPILQFEIDADTLVLARSAAQHKLKKEGFPYARVIQITELGPSKEPSPATGASLENTAVAIDPSSLLRCELGHPAHESYTPSNFGAER